jgi:hypothetical protein
MDMPIQQIENVVRYLAEQERKNWEECGRPDDHIYRSIARIAGWLEHEFDNHFGVCPHCYKTDGFANAGKSHRFYCKQHRVSWYVGSNLFSNWRDQTEEEQRRIWNEIGLNDFESVEPYHPAPYDKWLREAVGPNANIWPLPRLKPENPEADEPLPF